MILKSLVMVLCLLAPLEAWADPSFWKHEWPRTNFDKTSVSNWVEILSGGPPKDGIPALDHPQMIPVKQDGHLEGREPVVAVEIAGAEARAYPLRYLMWHEIVNDTVEDVPVAVTFCPLCNSAMSFDRRVPAGTLSFGVSGKLRHSDMVMYDRETHSWWQQAIGVAIVGDLTGTVLTPLPTWVEDWETFLQRNPNGLVMAEPSYPRQYGRNPYRRYDSARRPFLYSGEDPPHGILPLERVVRVGDRAWPLSRLVAVGRLQEAGVVIDWRAGQASALDSAEIAEGRDIGSIRVRDAAGQDLPHDVMFAFAFDAFWPQGTWMIGKGDDR